MIMYKIPGEGNSRRDLTPEDIALSMELGARGGFSPSLDIQKAPNYISDHMPPTRHMATGEMYDSKSKFREKTKELGLIEIGNETKYLTKKDTSRQMDKRSRVDAIQKSIYQLKNR